MFNPKQAGEEADAMIRNLNQLADTQGEDQAPEGESAIAAQETNAEPEAQVEPESVDQGTVAEPVVDDVAAQLAALRKDVEAANQRWKVAQGMIDKKDSELEQLRTLLAGLAEQHRTETKAAETTPESDPGIPTTRSVSAEDIEEFSPALYEFICKAARDMAHEVLRGYDARLNDRLGTVEASVQTAEKASVKTAQEMFEAGLTGRVNNWRELNTDAGFLEWLGQIDPYSGQARMDLLQQAYQALNVERVAFFFQTYAEQAGLIAPPETTAEAAPVAQQKTTGPGKFVSPGKSKATAGKSGGSEPRVWTRAEIAKLYDDHMAGRISHADFEKLERDVFKAQREQRIAG